MGITGRTIGGKADNNDFDTLFTPEKIALIYEALKTSAPSYLELRSALAAAGINLFTLNFDSIKSGIELPDNTLYFNKYGKD
jgi:uncharacterized protein YbcV (DUF1398 family)